MMNQQEITVIILSLMIFGVSSYNNGVGVDVACSNLVPNHGYSPQTGSLPYRVTFTPASFSPGQTVSVTLTSTSTGFKGFMIQAKRADTSQNQQLLGSFTVTAQTRQACTNQALVHNSNTVKSSLTFNWNSPSTSVGNVVFRVTFVQSLGIFWANQGSTELNEIIPTTTTTTTTTTPTTTTTTPTTTTSKPTTTTPTTTTTTPTTTTTTPTTTTTTPTTTTSKPTTTTPTTTTTRATTTTTTTPTTTTTTPTTTTTTPATTTTRATTTTTTTPTTTTTTPTTTTTTPATTTTRATTTTTTTPTTTTTTPTTTTTKPTTTTTTTPTTKTTTPITTTTTLASITSVTTTATLITTTATTPTTSTSLTPTTSTQAASGSMEVPPALTYNFTTSTYSTDNISTAETSTVVLSTSAIPTTIEITTTVNYQNNPSSNFVTPDPTCGDQKGCFTKCSNVVCDFTVGWYVKGTNAVYTLTSASLRTSGIYMALGFSSDSQMGDDSVIGCVYDNNTFAKYSCITVGKDVEKFSDDVLSPHMRKCAKNVTPKEIQLTKSNFVNGIFTCQITRPIAGLHKRNDLNQPWTLLFAKGSGTVTNGEADISYHDDKYLSESAVSARSYMTLSFVSPDTSLVKAHGCLMVAAWIFFASIGTIVARFYKPVMSDTICSQKIWFQIHRLSMALVVCLTAAGFIIIFVKNKEWSEIKGDEFYLKGHPIMGVIVMILTILNPLMALFRPHPGTTRRPLFNWAHFLVGMSAHILGVVTVFFGANLKSADTPYTAVYILGAYVAWQLFVYLLLEIVTRCECIKPSEKEVYELYSVDSLKSKQYSPPAKELMMKNIIFALHAFVVSALTASILALIAVGRKEL